MDLGHLAKGKEFGQTSPPLSVHINGILKKYPDGQIFKEIIQNADDAGAKTVQFFIDHRQHGTTCIPYPCPKFEKSEGPSLMSANDACFSEEDWKGIQNLERSIKAKDPFKVGKFGLGFNSVYHITDVPTIVSGETIAYLDPQQKIWPGKTGHAFEIADLVKHSPHVLSPFEEMLEFSNNGTLFQFPLRQSPSELSGNTYSTDKLEQLIDALRKEAKLLLLFLRSVEKIEVYHILSSGDRFLLFGVKVVDECVPVIRQQRRELTEWLIKAHSCDSYSVSSIYKQVFQLSVEYTDPSSQQVVKWLIANRIGSKSPAVLATAKEQFVFPWVGAAFELSSNQETSGRIFCSLPIPVETVSGLPVHVNGTFGLSDDRRSLMWPGIERQNDTTAKWNELLVKEVLPKCYAALIIQAIDYLQPKDVYSVCPNVESVRGTQWEGLLHPLFSALFREPVVWCKVTNEWVTIDQSVFIPQHNGLARKSVIHSALSDAGLKLVDVPPHVWRALQYEQTEVETVTPALAREKFRTNPTCYSNTDEGGKLVLLLYCLSDAQYTDLAGIELLPLANGMFTSFYLRKRCKGQYVYLCSSEYPRNLLPNLDHLLVDLQCPDDLQTHLYDLAQQNVTNLSLLTEAVVADLLCQSMPKEWQFKQEVSLPNAEFPSSWFETFWQWVKSKDLNKFLGKLVVPISDSENQLSNSFKVVKLSLKRPVIYVREHNKCTKTLQQVLSKLHVKYTLHSEFPFLEHQWLLKFLKPFSGNNVLDAIQMASNYIDVQLSVSEADSIRNFLASELVHPITDNHKLNVLKNLSMFIAMKQDKVPLSVAQCSSKSILKQALALDNKSHISVSNLPEELILFSSHDSRQYRLLRNVNVTFLDDITLLTKHVFPLIQKNRYPDHLIDSLMKEVLDFFPLFHSSSETFSSCIQSLPFVDAGSSHRQCPSSLFDPSIQELSLLFEGKNVFPFPPFNDSNYLQVLRQCGLQTLVSPRDIVNIITEISVPSCSNPVRVDQSKIIRSKAVLDYVGSEVFQTQLPCDRCTKSGSTWISFKQAFAQQGTQMSWLPVKAQPPEGYPPSLPWKGSNFHSHVVSANHKTVIVSSKDEVVVCNVIGSQMFVVVVDNPCVESLFPKRSITQMVVAHLEEVVANQDQISAEILSRIMDSVYSYLSKPHSANELSRLNSIQGWVYIRKHNRFVSPTLIALKLNQTFKQYLEPYIYILPENLIPYSKLFLSFGASQNITQSQIISVLGMIKDMSSIDDHQIDNAWRTVLSILNWITGYGTKWVSLSKGDTLYVPIESELKWPQLVKAEEVVYTDSDFLKEFLQSNDSDEKFTFVHSRISTDVAKYLELTPLSEHLDICEDTFAETGQHEPLSVRLKNILRDYKDGITIIKELLQNADDAEATEVNICYDARTHNVPSNSLFFPGMLESHGPALLFHNNKSFTEQDFENITKLAGGTKQKKMLKIGKFGVGFCSVYHITDVPSFVSQDRLCIFDPTLVCLRKEIKNPAQPGRRVKFTSNFITRSKQLVPYTGLFGFDPNVPYDGTIFRLPFRTSHSELSSKCYTEDTVQELFREIHSCCSKLLLFLQHVRSIKLYCIREHQENPLEVFEVTKRSTTALTMQLQPGVACQEISFTSSAKAETEQWLVASRIGKIKRKDTTASVACLLSKSSCGYTISKVDGEVFCFLPISLKTGLPVHVNSNFAVINNRRGIWTADDATSKADVEVLWNQSLMQTVIPQAYSLLLNALRELDMSDYSHSFYCLWPLKYRLTQRNPWQLLVSAVYELILADRLLYSKHTGRWIALSDSQFLQPGILCQSSSDPSSIHTPQCILDIVNLLQLPIVDLPIMYREEFSVNLDIINDKIFSQLFFDKLKSLTRLHESRNEVLVRMLECYASEYDDETDRSYYLHHYFTKHACIPCSPDGVRLKKCEELIEPTSPFAKLFSSEEGMFPEKRLIERHLVTSVLHHLGIMYKTVTCKLIIDRAKTITSMYQANKVDALKRVKLILKTIESNTDRNSMVKAATIDIIEFLPVLQKPPNYPMKWCGASTELSCGRKLMVAGYDGLNTFIAGSQVTFVCENSPSDGGCGRIEPETLDLLHIRRSPSVKEVVTHLRMFVDVCDTQHLSKELETFGNKMCSHVYKFLDERISTFNSIQKQFQYLEAEYQHKKRSTYFTQKKDHLQQKEQQLQQELNEMKELLSFPCVWNGNRFLNISLIARQWKLNGPYLYPVPSHLSYRRNLSNFLKIKEEFTIQDIQDTLVEMKKEFGDSPVSKECQEVLKQLLPGLFKLGSNDKSAAFSIMLPDEAYVLHLSTELAYNDAPWAPKQCDHTYYVNSIIPRDLAKQLNVIPVRSKFLEDYESSGRTFFSGVKFGQREQLTRRIQNIIRDYPFDITVLKELLQNADDAKAEKMYVILDKRHHGKESVVSEEWQKLQGPALLVWNDKTFSEKDLKGIQELGLGSKRSEAESIGQYGIGFNVVYHLTDCPSFISGGETLCVMDPHCRYAPNSTPMNPGRRYDKLHEGFWDKFPDMKSSYLRDGVACCPAELQGGSLFRFPLRHTYDLMKQSEIVDQNTRPLTGDDMHRHLNAWVPKMKSAMFFLNHITELRFYVIDENSNMCIQHHFCTAVDTDAQQKRAELHHNLATFSKPTGGKPCVILYPMTVSEIKHSGTNKQNNVDEKWLIQQGVGDIENEKQTWKYVTIIKPRHGIAAPLSYLETASKVKDDKMKQSKQLTFHGQLFCFLPLPVSTDLPVHINGNFILNSTRRNLWRSSDPNQEDNRSTWNNKLFLAIASSYAMFLVQCRTSLVTANETKLSLGLFDSIHQYYQLFPELSSSKEWAEIVKNVYSKLYSNNAPILAVLQDVTYYSHYKIMWHPLRSSPSTQVYFWKPTASSGDESIKDIKPVLKSIGMKISQAPYKLKRKFDKVLKEDEKLPEISPLSVYCYYTQFSHQCSPTGFPCAIENTMFKSVVNFKAFCNYMLQENEMKCKEFPLPPFGHPLLLTADGKLRCFDEHHKVIPSHYFELFVHNLDKFLHSDFLDVNYTSEYLVDCVPDGDHSASLKLVSKILDKALPSRLHTTGPVENCMAKDLLIKLWVCFTSDPTFQFHLSSILENWSLLLTTDGQLFSTAGSYLPVFPPNEHIDDDDAESYPCEVLAAIGMPFLDTTVVCDTEIRCPHLDQCGCILTNIYNLHQEKDLVCHFTSEVVEVLVDYLKHIDYRYPNYSVDDVNCRDMIRSLPLFENIDGTFSSVEEKISYVWPDNVCGTAYKKWMNSTNNVVFLKSNATWSKLATAECLEIRNVSSEEVYVEFIFPNFSRLTQEERYEHLQHIRDSFFYNLVEIGKGRSKKSDIRRAKQFIQAIKSLHCLGDTDEILRPVSEFYNHEHEIFAAFQSNFMFLPEYFTIDSDQCSEWIEFFEHIGLRMLPSKEEYLMLCGTVASGHDTVDDLQSKSELLLTHLFSMQAKEQNWHSDNLFLIKVSKIAFVCNTQLPALSWIAPQADQLSGELNTKVMTQLRGTVTKELATLLWTLKPVVSLPRNYNSYFVEECVLKNLDVTETPCIPDVINNITNICEDSRFANFELFYNYPNEYKPPNGGKGLSEVLLTNFQFLQNNIEKLSKTDIRILGNLHCVPVYCAPQTTSTVIKQQKLVVLVKPSHVVTCDVQKYYPFLHKLPNELLSVSTLLQQLGVKADIDLSHIQLILKLAYKYSDQQVLEMNSKKSVQSAVKQLYQILCSTSSANKSISTTVILTPLYLPSVESKLALSTDLVYRDRLSYSGHLDIDLNHLGMALFDLPVMEYGFYTSSLCQFLPAEIRPKGLSDMCIQTVLSDCQQVKDSLVCESLKQTLQLPMLPKSTLSVVKHFTEVSDDVCVKLESVLKDFFSNIGVVTVRNLQIDITHKTSRKSLGKQRSCYFYCSDGENGYILYFDLKISRIVMEYAIDELTECLLSKIVTFYPRNETGVTIITNEIKKVCKFLLKAQSPSDIIDVMERAKIAIDSTMIVDDFTPKLGGEIPERWHFRLDQDCNNLFYPMEYVGYEVNGRIIIAQIIHTVFEEESLNFEQHANYRMMYKIYTSKDDESGTEASALDLFKLLPGSSKMRPDPKLVNKQKALVLVEESAHSSGSKIDLYSTKRILCEQLRDIWKLPREQKMKAIRRLYFKWHPDKNLDNCHVAEEVFKFLVSQIENLEAGLPIDDLDGEPYDIPKSRSRKSMWKQQFHQWNDTVQQHNYYFEQSKSRATATNPSRDVGDCSMPHSPRSSSNLYDPFEDSHFQLRKQPDEGQRWVKQAIADYQALCTLHDQVHSHTCLAGHVCFMAHQVAEKALKGCMYFLCGLDERGLSDHNLTRHAYSIKSVRPQEAADLVAHTIPLEDYYLDPRYPNRCLPPKTPSEMFNQSHADMAEQHAQAVLSTVQHILKPAT